MNASHDRLVDHCRTVAKIIPVFGFYLQPAVGGRFLHYDFWRAFLDIEHVVAIKVAPFNRYQTLDVVRALADSGRQSEVALYTGNDDNIIPDLLTDHFSGGLLGQWAVWTKRAVEMFAAIKACRATRGANAYDILSQSAGLTDANAALFDARNDFAGCIAGLHEVLRRQGLLAGRWCLDPTEDLSAGQMEEIDRVCRAYPHLQDDDFVAAHLSDWLQ